LAAGPLGPIHNALEAAGTALNQDPIPDIGYHWGPRHGSQIQNAAAARTAGRLSPDQRLPEVMLFLDGEVVPHTFLPSRSLEGVAPKGKHMKPCLFSVRRDHRSPKCPQLTEEGMRGLGMVLLTGAAAIIIWRIFAAMLVGLLGLVFKVALIFAVVYFLMKIFEGRKEKE
jgi:hypothetical protein